MIQVSACLEQWLGSECEIGMGTVKLIKGWAFHPQQVIQAIHLAIGDVSFPIKCIREPRRDIVQRYRMAAQAAVYQSGFWGLVPITGAWVGKQFPVQLLFTLADGTTQTQALGDVRFTSVAHSISTLALPARCPKVIICMATYNPGKAAFRRQVESIIQQTFTDWLCIVNDDGSTASRYSSILKTCAVDPRFIVRRNPQNLGFYRNFEEILRAVPRGAEFVALADQDDYWYPEKLQKSLDAFLPDTQLVYSDMRIVKADGRVISESYWTHRKNNHTHLDTLLIVNTVTGAASVFRAALLDKILPFPDPVGPTYHDQWIGSVALMQGRIGYVAEPLYDYIQHGKNIIGHCEFAPPRLFASLGTTVRLCFCAIRPRALCDKVQRFRFSTLAIHATDYRRVVVFAANLRARFPDAPFGKRSVLARFKDTWLSVVGLTITSLKIHWRGETTTGLERRWVAAILINKLDKAYVSLATGIRKWRLASSMASSAHEKGHHSDAHSSRHTVGDL